MKNVKLTMTIDADSCNGDEEQFYLWMLKNHPEVDVEYTPDTSGGSGLWEEDDDGSYERVYNDFWDEYCISDIQKTTQYEPCTCCGVEKQTETTVQDEHICRDCLIELSHDSCCNPDDLPSEDWIRGQIR